MTFPDAPLDVTAQFLLGGAWTDVTDDVRGMTAEDGRITITRGMRNEASVALAGSVRLALSDQNGDYEWRNPAKANYGLLKRGTPLRVYRGTPHVGAANSSLTDSTSHVAPSVVAPTNSGLLVCSWACPQGFGQSYTPPGTMTGPSFFQTSLGSLQTAHQSIAASGATGTRTATFTAAEDYVASSVLLHGTGLAVEQDDYSFADFTTDSGTAPGWWLVVSAYYGWDDPVMEKEIPDFPSDDDGGGWMVMADTGVLEPADAEARFMMMRTWIKRVRRGGAFTIRMHAPTTLPSSASELAVLAGLRSVSGVGTWDVRAHARVSSLPHRRDGSGNVRWVPLEASGALRQIDRRKSPSQSTIYRTVMSRDQDGYRVAYWPCEDGSGATSLGSAVAGGEPMTVSGDVQGGDYDGFSGSQPICTLNANGAKVVGRVRPYAAGSTFYRGLFAVPSAGLGSSAGLVNLYCTGTARRYKVEWSSTSGGSLQLRSFDGDGTLLAESAVVTFGVNGAQFLLSVELVQDGADVDWLMFVRKTTATQVATGNTSSGTFAGQTVGRVSRIQIGGGSNAGLTFGHQMVGNSQSLIFNIRDALVGWAGETAANRVRRLGREYGVQCAVVGDPGAAGDLPMGPERAGQTLVANFRECAATGGGLLYEPREFYGVTYRTARSLYGQDTPAVALTFGASGEVMPPLEPVPDDALVVNDVTVSNVGGGTARAVQETGPLNVNDPEDDEDGIGILDTSATVNVASSVDLPNQAHWRRHAGTLNEDRFPQLELKLQAMAAAGKTALLEEAASLDVGDRVTVDALPSSYGPNGISQLAVGMTEVMSQKEWQITPTCVPEATYGRVLRYATAAEAPAAGEPVFYGSDSAVFAPTEELTTTETGIEISCGAGPEWVHEGANYDIVVGGERMTVTAVSAATGTYPDRRQTLTVTRSVNGVVKTHPLNSRVELFYQGVWGL